MQKVEFIEFLLSSNEKFIENEQYFYGVYSMDSIIIEIFDQIPQGDPLILFNLLYFLSRSVEKSQFFLTETIMKRICALVNPIEKKFAYFPMVKLDEKDKKSLEDAFSRYVIEFIIENATKQPFLNEKLKEFSKIGLIIPTSMVFYKSNTKWTSLAKIIEIQRNSIKNEKNPNFLKRKEENHKLREDNEKLQGLIKALEKKLQGNIKEFEELKNHENMKKASNFENQENNENLDKNSYEDLQQMYHEKEVIISHLVKLNEDYQLYNQQLMEMRGEKTRDSQMLLFQYQALKDPKMELKAKIKEMKDENNFLKQKLVELYGANPLEKPPEIPLMVSKIAPVNKRPRNYDSQLINMTRNSFDQTHIQSLSPQRIFDPMRSFKMERVDTAVEVLIQKNQKNNKETEKSHETPKKQEFAPFYEIFNSDMKDSVVLDPKDKSFYKAKTNKKEEILIDFKGKLKENSFLVNFSNKEFKDFEEFSSGRLNQMKKACLTNKGVIYEDDELQIGIVSGVFYNNEEILLKITTYYGNLAAKDLEEFDVKFIGNSTISLWTKPRVGKKLMSKTQEKQELILKFHEIPFNCLIQKCNYKSNDKIKRLIQVIPGTINKFLLEQATNIKEFKQKWSILSKKTYCYCQEFELNSFIMKGPSNMKKYFQYLIHLNPEEEYDFMSKKGKYKLGGYFLIESKEMEILLKLVFCGNGKFYIKAAGNGNVFKICEFLLKTLMFLLKK